jgi:predicted RNase H-like nuclease (RuvC/YqgF family)
MDHVDELISTLACKRHEEYELGKKLECLEHELRSHGRAHDETTETINMEITALRRENEERTKENTELRKRLDILEV